MAVRDGWVTLALYPVDPPGAIVDDGAGGLRTNGPSQGAKAAVTGNGADAQAQKAIAEQQRLLREQVLKWHHRTPILKVMPISALAKAFGRRQNECGPRGAGPEEEEAVEHAAALAALAAEATTAATTAAPLPEPAAEPLLVSLRRMPLQLDEDFPTATRWLQRQCLPWPRLPECEPLELEEESEDEEGYGGGGGGGRSRGEGGAGGSRSRGGASSALVKELLGKVQQLQQTLESSEARQEQAFAEQKAWQEASGARHKASEVRMLQMLETLLQRNSCPA